MVFGPCWAPENTSGIFIFVPRILCLVQKRPKTSRFVRSWEALPDPPPARAVQAAPVARKRMFYKPFRALFPKTTRFILLFGLQNLVSPRTHPNREWLLDAVALTFLREVALHAVAFTFFDEFHRRYVFPYFGACEKSTGNVSIFQPPAELSKNPSNFLSF